MKKWGGYIFFFLTFLFLQTKGFIAGTVTTAIPTIWIVFPQMFYKTERQNVHVDHPVSLTSRWLVWAQLRHFNAGCVIGGHLLSPTLRSISAV